MRKVKVAKYQEVSAGAGVEVFLPRLRQPYEAEIFLGLKSELAASGARSAVDCELCHKDLATWSGEQKSDSARVCVIIGNWADADLHEMREVPCVVTGLLHAFRTGQASVLPSKWRMVSWDDVEIGRLAAKHLVDRRLHHLVWLNEYQRPEHQWAAERVAGFVEEGEALSAHVSRLSPRGGPKALAEALRHLSKPCGIFCVTDAQAARLLDLCRLANLDVPGQLAILGVNNDPVWVESSSPSLSSVATPARELGQAMGRMVRYFLEHGQWPETTFEVGAPSHVVTRASTDMLAVEDPRLLAAVGYIRQQDGVGIGVEDVCRRAGVSRRTLETLFRRYLGRSPYEEIQGTRLERARTLVCDSSLPITLIAERCGLATDRFGSLFRKRFGLTPLKMRKQHR